MENNLTTRQQQWLGGIAGAILLIMAISWGWARLPPPQLSDDPATFDTVDALFTALTTRDNQRLSDCAQRLEQAQQAGQLPAAAAARLTSIIEEAKAGKWEPAAKRLYQFMYGQQRR